MPRPGGFYAVGPVTQAYDRAYVGRALRRIGRAPQRIGFRLRLGLRPQSARAEQGRFVGVGTPEIAVEGHAVGLAAAAGMVWMSPTAGGMAAAFAVVSALKYRRFALAQFGGVTGDTSGFFLQLCELCGLIGVWIGGLL